MKQQGEKHKGKANWAATSSNPGHPSSNYPVGLGSNQVSKKITAGSGQDWAEPNSVLQMHPDRTNQERASNSNSSQVHLVRAENLGTTGFASQTETIGKQLGQGMKSSSNNNLNNWVIDSGTIDHMTFSKTDLTNLRKPIRDGILNANGMEYPVES